MLEGGRDPPVGTDAIRSLTVTLVPAEPVTGDGLEVLQRLADSLSMCGKDGLGRHRIAEAP